MNDSQILQDVTQIAIIKKALEEDLGVDLSNLLTSVQNRESRLANRTTISVNIPTETKTRIDAIITADGNSPSDATRADLIEEMVDVKFSDYEADGSFNTDSDENA